VSLTADFSSRCCHSYGLHKACLERHVLGTVRFYEQFEGHFIVSQNMGTQCLAAEHDRLQHPSWIFLSLSRLSKRLLLKMNQAISRLEFT